MSRRYRVLVLSVIAVSIAALVSFLVAIWGDPKSQMLFVSSFSNVTVDSDDVPEEFESGHSEPSPFVVAVPVWIAGREREKNLTVGFRAVVNNRVDYSRPVVLRLTGASLYRVTVNGEFVGSGPARAAHGYYRVDELDITASLIAERNIVAIESVGYNFPGYFTLNQPSFLLAEIISGEKVLAATSDVAVKTASGTETTQFTATVTPIRERDVGRYGPVRNYWEFYRLSPGWDDWKRLVQFEGKGERLTRQNDKRLLPRRVAFPEYASFDPLRVVSTAMLEISSPKVQLDDDSPNVLRKGEDWKRETIPDSEESCGTRAAPIFFRTISDSVISAPQKTREMKIGCFSLKTAEKRLLDFGVNYNGFVTLDVVCSKKTYLAVAFDELLTDGHVNPLRLSCVNWIQYVLEPGRYQIETIEPYSMRYADVLCLSGDCEIRSLRIREFAHPKKGLGSFYASDSRLNRIFEAATRTYRQNAVDFFTDCPSRERAGWLCDSFFTARAAYDLTGTTLVERCFFENFALRKKLRELPDGMLPMCYPADQPSGNFIPNWALWFVVQLGDYYKRSGDHETVEALRERTFGLLKYLAAYENKEGLLENTPGTCFVEWSEANNFVQDVNFPSNMLYAGALSTAASLYKDEKLKVKASRIRDAIRKFSFDGEFFVDNVTRSDGKLRRTENRSEICQYFAFYFGVADRDRDAKLWRALCDDFGPKRKMTKKYQNICFAAPFIGNMIRMELLSAAGECRQIHNEEIAYLLYMADATGTLWEFENSGGSCSHGFASHAVRTLYRDILGVRDIDAVSRKLHVTIPDVDLNWCEGEMPTKFGLIRLRWDKKGDRVVVSLKAPKEFDVKVENASGKELARDE